MNETEKTIEKLKRSTALTLAVAEAIGITIDSAYKTALYQAIEAARHSEEIAKILKEACKE